MSISETAVPADLLTLADYEAAAEPGLDPMVWDFVTGGAGDERALAANVTAFDRTTLRPRILVGGGIPETKTTVLGRSWPAPLGVAPMAYHTLIHPEGEVATARGTGAIGLPLVVGTFAGRTLEDIAAAAAGPLWFQVYCFKDRATTQRLIERAERAGFEALVLTADAPRLGRRRRDLRNGFRLPTGIAPANLVGDGFASPAEHAQAEFDPALSWSVIEWLSSVSSLPVVVKGVLTGVDAGLAVAAGADAVVVSNHGGRQLDAAPASLEILPEIVAAIDGACPVLLDGGVRRGADILAALALGADAVLVGRPVLHGLAVDADQGVTDVLGILVDELTEAMMLTGTRSIADAGIELVRPDRSTAPSLDVAGPGVVRPRPARPSATGADGLFREDLHGSLSDPVLDTMTFLNEITQRYPSAVSFAPGRPQARFFEVEEIFTNLRRYLDYLADGGASPDRVRSAIFQYGPTGGLIRELIADSLRQDETIDVAPESIVVTVGAQEAMLLAVRALIAGPQDTLLVSSPCYVGITGVARLLDIVPAAVAESASGLCCADLEAAILEQRRLGHRPRAFYVVPDHSNPSGNTMSLDIRRELLELAQRQDILILEDSPYRLVSPGPRLPSLKSLDRSHRVVHIGSFAKTLFPGARIGYVIADQPIRDATGATVGRLADELCKIKSMVTVNTSPVSQAVVAGMLLAMQGRTAQATGAAAAAYGTAMRVMLQQLEIRFPPAERIALGVSWNQPSGGFFLTLTVPFRADESALMRSAEDFGVIWTPMSYFYPDGGGEQAIRLSISSLSPVEIEDGGERLARFVRAEAQR